MSTTTLTVTVTPNEDVRAGDRARLFGRTYRFVHVSPARRTQAWDSTIEAEDTGATRLHALLPGDFTDVITDAPAPAPEEVAEAATALADTQTEVLDEDSLEDQVLYARRQRSLQEDLTVAVEEWLFEAFGCQWTPTGDKGTR